MDNMEPTKELYVKLLLEFYECKKEEREMALDRYRRADEQMENAESFVLMGKNAISFLKQAADSSDGIEKIAKEIKSIVYKDSSDEGGSSSESFNRNDVIGLIEEQEREEQEKEKQEKEEQENKDN